VKVQRIFCWGNLNRNEDTKLVKKIIYWNPIGPRGSRDRSPVTGDFFRGIRQFHVLWGRLSL